MPNEAVGAEVEFRDLNKRYGHTKALDHFNCEFHSGELVVLLGPSGCGKTTALRALTGLMQVDSGQIVVNGRDITHTSAAKRNMAMVFQQYSLFPNMTVRQNVEFGLTVRKVDSKRRVRQAMEALEMVGLANQADKYTHQMSGGQQQRVALARALVLRPAVLALDEPLSALDAKVRVQLRGEIRRLQLQSGLTTLFVTHDQEEALAVADRVGVMKEGKLQQIAEPWELYNEPANEFVATFIGESSRIPAVIRDGSAFVGDQEIPILKTSTKRTNGEATILVRPESVQLEMVQPHVPRLANQGVVKNLTFLGSTAKVEVEMPSGITLTAQITPSESMMVTKGQRVALRIEPKAVLAVAPDDVPQADPIKVVTRVEEKQPSQVS
ncbi:ABC transporter ATP-binding protein [Mobiluncus sp.]|uniref:ABC transporter ATP-binding protein n=1 Tax=Mobiluncus sp. TaxID=47293 RepID=UPI002A9109A7|nr:ABC transporter ATP-binding protein [Mobiluncus sp.]MDY6076472.1 ABC transporter ATP-binding protein [Mobiluncus sp.]